MNARVVAVSVAQPTVQVINGHPMPSSIVRDASAGPVFFGPDGPAGNATALHTEQVCAFCAERYDHWSRELGVDRGGWADCFFGENLMLAGLTEEDVHVGDRLRTGGGVVLEVTGPRSNCAKLTWRMGAPPGFLRTLVAAGWIGFYLRVVESGWVAAGDAVEVVRSRGEQPTIGALTRAIHEQQSPDLDLLRRASVADGLGAQTREVLRSRIRDVEDVWRTRDNRWPGWRAFVVSGKRMEAPGVLSVRLSPADGGPVAGYRAGQFLTVRVPTEDGPVSRAWSLSDYGTDDRAYRITVKLQPGGAGSAWIHGVPLGADVEVRPPNGQFVLDRSTFRRVVLISAGIGVTPVLAMLKAHAERAADASPLVWMHSARSSHDLAFRDEIAAALAANPGFSRRVHLTAPLPTDRPGVDFDHAGRITGETLAEFIRAPYQVELIGRTITAPGHNSEVYVCGPPAFEDMVRRAFTDARTVPQYVRSETFHPRAGRAGGPGPVETACVEFRDSAVRRSWTRDAGGTLLDLALEAGLMPDYACRSGSCGACAVGLVAGRVCHEPEPHAVIPAGQVLLCCARPASAELSLAA